MMPGLRLATLAALISAHLAAAGGTAKIEGGREALRRPAGQGEDHLLP